MCLIKWKVVKGCVPEWTELWLGFPNFYQPPSAEHINLWTWISKLIWIAWTTSSPRQAWSCGRRDRCCPTSPARSPCRGGRQTRRFYKDNSASGTCDPTNWKVSLLSTCQRYGSWYQYQVHGGNHITGLTMQGFYPRHCQDQTSDIKVHQLSNFGEQKIKVTLT